MINYMIRIKKTFLCLFIPIIIVSLSGCGGRMSKNFETADLSGETRKDEEQEYDDSDSSGRNLGELIKKRLEEKSTGPDKDQPSDTGQPAESEITEGMPEYTPE